MMKENHHHRDTYTPEYKWVFVPGGRTVFWFCVPVFGLARGTPTRSSSRDRVRLGFFTIFTFAEFTPGTLTINLGLGT